MFVWWLHGMFLRSADDGGSGGGTPPPATPPASPPAGDGTPPADPPATPPGDTPPEGTPPEGAPPESDFYRPQGLPEHLAGTNDRETIDKLLGAVQGYRQRDTERQVPDDAAAYARFGDDLPETIAPHIKGLANDTAFQRVSEAAKKHGVPVPAFQALTTELYSLAQEMGALEPFLDVEAEKKALTPDDARHLPEGEQRTARERRMNDNFAWVDQLAERENGKVDKDVFDYVKTELGDSAKGHRFFEYLRAQMGGDRSNEPTGGGAPSGGDARADLARRAALPENTPGHPKFDKASFDQLQKDYETKLGG